MASGSDDTRLCELLARWEEGRKRGEPASAESLCTDCPDLVDQLRERIRALEDWELFEGGQPATGCGEGGRRVAESGGSALVTLRLDQVEFHDEGGLGEVFRARDEGFGRAVALKFLRPRFARDPECRLRFLREAEVTARLEHPGIVPIYGLGEDTSGRPCYAMRFVDGTTLKEAIRVFHAAEATDPQDRNRAFRRLLQHFRVACTTVAYAHSRGVLHRDLKPSNIMLDRFDETLVLDWGLAQLFTPEGSTGPGAEEWHGADPGHEAVDLRTMGGTGTLGFMSPEQQAGRWDQVGPASDVFSLGATLYVLLTDECPFPGRSRAEVADNVERGHFDPPRHRNPGIHPALEAICLKAMARRPEDRYATALELADDLENWLADEPVSAWRAPWTEAARRHLVRYRTLAASVAVAVFIAAIGLGLLAIREARSNRLLAGRNQALRQAVRALETSNRELQAARALADRRTELALDAIGRFREVVADNPDVQSQPNLRLRLLREPIEFYRQFREGLKSSGETRPEALAQLASANFQLAALTAMFEPEGQAAQGYHEALELWRRLVEDYPDVPSYRAHLALVQVNLADLDRVSGRLAEAQARLRETIDLLTNQRHPAPPDTLQDFALSRSWTALGLVQRTAGQADDARFSYERAIELCEILARAQPDSPPTQAHLAKTLDGLGSLHRAADRFPEARACFERAHAIHEARVRSDPANPGYRFDLAQVSFNLGNLALHDESSGVSPKAHYERARELQEELVRDHPAVPSYRAVLAKTCGQLGILRRFAGKPEEGRPLMERARGFLEGLTSAHPENLVWRGDLAITLSNLGNLDELAGRPGDALALYREAAHHLTIVAQRQPRNAAIRAARDVNFQTMALLLRKLGQLDEAVSVILERRKLWSGEPGKLYEVARELAQCAPRPAPRLDRGTTEEEADRQRCVGLGLNVLREAIEAGYRDTERLRTDPDLESLRQHPGFQALLADLTFPVEPFAR